MPETTEALPIAKIDIPEDRFGENRTKDDEDLRALVESIQEFGILEPVILDEDNGLIAGERRVIAAALGGRTELEHGEFRYVYNVSDIDKRRMELEENVLRKDLTWSEEAEAISEIHKMKMEEDPDWDSSKTAALIGRSRRSAQDYIRVGEEMEEDPDLKEKSTLYGAVKEIAKKKEIQRRKEAVKRKEKGKGPQRKAVIHQGDALDLIGQIPDESIDAVITNPPFGVDLQLGHEHMEVYEDDEDYVTDLVRGIVPEIYRVLKPDTWAIIFWDIKKLLSSKYQELTTDYMLSTTNEEELHEVAERGKGLRQWLLEAGFDYVSPLPNIWVKPNKTQGLVGNPDKGLVVAYEAFLMASKGDARVLRPGLQNIFIYDTPASKDRVHPLQMPVDFTHFLSEMVCLGGETILDPFAGSGSIGLGALERQCNFIGFELDEELAERGQMLLSEHEHAKAD